MKFRKKPVEIEALRWPGHEGEPFDSWLTKEDHGKVEVGPADEFDRGPLLISTLEGVMRADPGDWVIRGVQGELYPCKRSVFEATYERVGDG